MLEYIDCNSNQTLKWNQNKYTWQSSWWTENLWFLTGANLRNDKSFVHHLDCQLYLFWFHFSPSQSQSGTLKTSMWWHVYCSNQFDENRLLINWALLQQKWEVAGTVSKNYFSQNFFSDFQLLCSVVSEPVELGVSYIPLLKAPSSLNWKQW